MNKIKQLPEFITFTGLDDRTDLDEVDYLTTHYPIEIGILYSLKNRDARYPSKQTVAEACQYRFIKSLHLCGQAARDFVELRLPQDIDLENFTRVQVNGSMVPKNVCDVFYDLYRTFIIEQQHGNHEFDNRLNQLYDPSGGSGTIPSECPKLPNDGRLYGYAGGMGPDTVIDYLQMIDAELGARYWIDMESNVRTNGWFDLGKVRKVCELVYDE